MAVFTCKMCGGTLEIEEGMLIATCRYCGTKQTLPRLLSEKTVNLYDRANHFRRNNEYDKAMGIYERILDEDDTDSEAYWSLVLCRYGIEYVEDPGTHKRIPTVNRAQYTSIYEDDNYKMALQCATPDQRTIYENEARDINEIQRGYLEISQSEEPFDVFICYKETDENGDRTHDSVLAQDIYYQLLEENLRVFFARITLEDKLGCKYEPYIFAALTSAKVMIVLGTKPEYFNAVWVKNEWTRYLALAKTERKTLIPAFRDMDPYDLPEEFSHLQAQDMSKIGCVQDLVRGVCKIVNKKPAKVIVKDEPQITEHVKTTVSTEEALVQRAFIFLEDKEWDSASEYFEKALDIDPKYALAYVGKMLAELKLTRIEMLVQCEESFETNSNYKKAMRFADPKLAQSLNSYLTVIKERGEVMRKDAIYRAACAMMSGRRYDEAIEKFNSIIGWRDSRDRIEICRQKTKNNQQKVETDHNKRVYDDAMALMNSHTHSAIQALEFCKRAKTMFESLGKWNDSELRFRECERRIRDLTSKADQERAERQKQEKIKAAENKRKTKKAIAILSCVIAAVVLIILIINLVLSISETSKIDKQYDAAVSLVGAGKYEEAIDAFKQLNGYKESNDYIVECETKIKTDKYNNAIDLMKSAKYDEAIKIFNELGEFEDSSTKIIICKQRIKDEKYNQALSLMEEGSYSEAIEIFKSLNGYRDSDDQIKICEEMLNQ